MVIAWKLGGLVIVAAWAVWPHHRRRRAGIEVVGMYLLFPRHGSLLGTFACPFHGPVDKMGLCVHVVVTTQELGAQVVVARGLSVRVVVAAQGISHVVVVAQGVGAQVVVARAVWPRSRCQSRGDSGPRPCRARALCPRRRRGARAHVVVAHGF